MQRRSFLKRPIVAIVLLCVRSLFGWINTYLHVINCKSKSAISLMGVITYVMHYVPPLNSAKEQKKTVLPLKNALLQLRNLPIDSKEIYKKY